MWLVQINLKCFVTLERKYEIYLICSCKPLLKLADGPVDMRSGSGASSGGGGGPGSYGGGGYGGGHSGYYEDYDAYGGRGPYGGPPDRFGPKQVSIIMYFESQLKHF